MSVAADVTNGVTNPWTPSARCRKPATLMHPIEESGRWYPTEFAHDKKYLYVLSAREIDDIFDAVHSAERQGLEIKDINRANFPLRHFSSALADIREELLEGRGCALVRGLPIDGRTRYQSVAAFWGVSSYLGTAFSQNTKGHLLGHVTNKGSSITTATGRGYQSNESLGFHADGCDVTSLFCLQTAKSGGLHKLCSSVAVYNEMLERRPDLANELSFFFYMSRKGQIPVGETKPWFRLPVFSVQDGYFTARGASNTLIRGHQLPGVPPLTPLQLEAIELYQKLASELAIDIEFERGDMSYANSHVTLHARTKFEDWPESERRRHLLRLWLRMEEGRRPLIPEFAREIARGITVEGVEPIALIEA